VKYFQCSASPAPASTNTYGPHVSSHLSCIQPTYGLRILILLLLVSLGAYSRTADAQTAYAPGGLIIHPTAFTSPRNSFFLYSAAFTEESSATSSLYPTSLSYSPTDNLQVSAILAYHQSANLPSHSHIGTFDKLQLVPDAPNHPAFAISYAYVANDFRETSVSGVASHNFTRNKHPLLTLHLGAEWMKVPPYAGSKQDTSGFVGLEVPLSRLWTVFGETGTRLDFDTASATSFGVMYHARHSPDFTLGFLNTGSSKDLRFFFGVGYPFGG